MEALKRYLAKNAEEVFVLIILAGVAGINYFVPYKLVFLNFFFLVVLLGAYYLEMRKAVLGAVLCALMVIVHVYYFPSSFMPGFGQLDLWMNILAWCSFLILTGAVVGQLTHSLKTKVQRLQKLNQDLENLQEEAGMAEEEELEEAEEEAVLVGNSAGDSLERGEGVP